MPWNKLLIICALFFAFTLQAQSKPEFFQTTALPGDGIYSLLRRYQLDQHSCNFTRFYELNKLKKNARLVAGKKYFIPILLYPFNGKTIRSSIGINDWNLAVRIQTYNEQMFEEAMREESFKKDKVLWVPYHELNCAKQDLEIPSPVNSNPEKVSGGKRKFPIFGKDYAYTPLESNKLRGKVFYIVGGHGGPDPGAMSKRGNYSLCEDEYAYDVALRIGRKLIAHGATTYIVNRDPNDGIRNDKYLKCDTDEVLWGNVKMSQSQKVRLTQRSDIINDLHKKHKLQGVQDQRLIIIHVDSRSKNERTDLFFYHKSNDKAGRQLANKLHKTVKAKYKKYRKGGHYYGTVSSRDLHMLRETTVPAVYIELANIRNTYDQQRIVLSTNREALAQWLFEGLIN